MSKSWLIFTLGEPWCALAAAVLVPGPEMFEKLVQVHRANFNIRHPTDSLRGFHNVNLDSFKYFKRWIALGIMAATVLQGRFDLTKFLVSKGCSLDEKLYKDGRSALFYIIHAVILHEVMRKVSSRIYQILSEVFKKRTYIVTAISFNLH